MIVIPMAGLSSRFTRAGYDRPKYMLPLADGRSAFAHAAESFRYGFESEPFLFIARRVQDTEAFLHAELAALGVRDARVVMLDRETAGQAETVEAGLDAGALAPEAPITIFNIDTFRPGLTPPALPAASAGYLEVFRGEGANWSFVGPRPGTDHEVAETTEKRPISDLCCTGLYHFARAGDFRDALLAERAAPQMPELYVAPLYNHLIRAGRTVHYVEIAPAEVIFCGVPAEYEALLASGWTGG